MYSALSSRGLSSIDLPAAGIEMIFPVSSAMISRATATAMPLPLAANSSTASNNNAKKESAVLVASASYDEYAIPSVIVADGTSAVVDVGLPAASPKNDGLSFIIKVIDITNAVTVDGGSPLTAGVHVVVSDGSAWAAY